MSPEFQTPPREVPSSPAPKQPAGFWARLWDKLEDVYDAVWIVCDPVTKVCYTHLSHHYEHKYRQKFPIHHTKVFYFDMFLWFLLSALLVLWFFLDAFLPLLPVPTLLRIDATSPTTVVSGMDTDFAYTFKNESDQTINCPVLRIKLPANTFMSQKVEDATAADRTCTLSGENSGARLAWDDAAHTMLIYTLNAMAPQSTHNVRFIARTYGATGDAKPLAAELTYWELAATEPSHVSVRTEPAVTASALELSAALPPKIQRGLPQVIAFTYKNTGDASMNGTAIRVTPPEDFVITGATPAFTGTREWRVGKLASEEFGTLTLYGYFKASPQQNPPAPTFAVRGYVTEEGAANVLVEAKRFNADTRAADLTFYQELLSPRGSGTVNAGGTLQVAVHYHNDSQRTLKDLRITVDAGAPFVVATGSESGTAIVIDSRTKSDLAEIAPNEGGVVMATFTAKEVISAEELGNLPLPVLHVASRGEYTLADAASADATVRVDTNVTDISVATRLGLEAAALYYTKGGDQLGVGPLPPVVGQETKYRVFLTVSATTSAVDGTVVEATLPDGVTYAGGASVNNGSAIDYLPTAHKVRWQVGQIPAFSGGSDVSRVGASFEVTITPVKEQVGASPELLTDLSAHGRDAATGASVSSEAATLTTDLPFDVRAAGKGAVVGVRSENERF